MFKSKLTKTFKNINAWSELADALQHVNDAVIEPTLDRLKGMTNVFTMHPDDLQVRFNELGAFFAVGLTAQEDVPLLLQQRTDEIHYKGYEYPLTKTFEREFLSVPMTWQQLYAPKDLITHPYGSKFLLLRDIINNELNRDDYFKTMRAVIFTRLDHVNGKFASMDEFEQLLNRVVVPLIPTHIVFDGQQYFLKAIIYGDKPYKISVPHTEIRDTRIKVASHPLPSKQTINVTQIKIIDVKAEKLHVNGNKPILHNLITFDDFALDMIPLDINSTQGNWS